MKKVVPLLMMCFSCSFVFAQGTATTIRGQIKIKRTTGIQVEYTAMQTAVGLIKFPVRGKQIIIDDQEATLTVEGYDGDDLVIEPEANTLPSKISTMPAGFSLITPGLRDADNTINYEVLKNEATLFSIRLRSVYNNGKMFKHFHVKVPKKAHLKVVFVMSQLGAKMTFKNLTNELEVEGTAPIIEFSNITGPLTLSEGVGGHRIGGTEKVIVSHLQMPKNGLENADDAPFFNIITSYGDVDISLPADTKATIQVDARYGNLYSDLDLVKLLAAFPRVKNRYTGILNGGGKMIVITAGYGNVFLRKDK